MKKYNVVGNDSEGMEVKSAGGPVSEEMANIVADAMIVAGYTDVKTVSTSADCCKTCHKVFGPEDMIFAVYGMLYCDGACAAEAIDRKSVV